MGARVRPRRGLDAVRSAGEWLANSSSVVEDDRLNGGVQAWTKHEETQQEDENVDDGGGRLERAAPERVAVKVPVGDGPEDEAKERVESSRHDAQKVTHGWNDCRRQR